MHLSTQLINKGYQSELSEGSLVTPVFRTSTFCFPSSESGKRSFEIAYQLDKPQKDENTSLIYSRVNNPNMEILEERLSILNNSETSLVFSSGMGAISNTCLSFLKPGDSLLYSEPVYGGSDFLFTNTLPAFGIKTYPFSHRLTLEELTNTIKKCPSLKMIFLETPCNPILDLISIKDIYNLKNTINKDILILVDNTMIGPLYSEPLKFGADLVVLK